MECLKIWTSAHTGMWGHNLPTGKVIHPKYSKDWTYTVAHSTDCVYSKMLNHGWFLSFFKFILCPIHWRFLFYFFYRAGFIYSLNVAADFADMIGESEGSQYRSKADEILEATKDHYGKFGEYIYECDVRPQDGAVIHSIATFGKFLNL